MRRERERHRECVGVEAELTSLVGYESESECEIEEGRKRAELEEVVGDDGECTRE